MNKIKVIIFILVIASRLNAQEVFNPSNRAFFNSLNDNSVAWIKYNKSGKYKYGNKKVNLTNKKRINFLFVRDENLDNEFILENLDFTNCGEIIFWVRHKTKIKLKNCKFSFKTHGGIKFYFENSNYLYPLSNTDTKILIDSCTFVHNNLSEVTKDFVAQLYFSKDIYPKYKDSEKEYFLKSVNVKQCKFQANNYSSLTTSHFHSLLFYRENSNISYSYISIENSSFNYKNFKNGISEGINFSNNVLSNFRENSVDYYVNNKNISIIRNKLITDSQKPGHAIFIHGPFRKVNIKNNYIDGFGLNMPQNTNTVVRDGAIHIYGARQLSSKSKYSNNLDSIFVENNTLSNCRSIGLRLSGFSNAVVTNNLVKIGNETSYWKKFSDKQDISGIEISTGDYFIANKQSINANVNSNIIMCNYNSLGILIKFVKNFSIFQNEIYQPNSYGILYFANKNVTESNIGISSVEENIIDFKDRSIDDLKSGFFNRNYKIKYAGINFWRELDENSNKNSNENLTIKNNKIKIIDKKISRVKHNLDNANKTNIYIIEE